MIWLTTLSQAVGYAVTRNIPYRVGRNEWGQTFVTFERPYDGKYWAPTTRQTGVETHTFEVTDDSPEFKK